MSDSASAAAGCTSRKHAAPIVKSYSDAISEISSVEYDSPPGVAVHSACPRGGSPRSASTLSIPASRISSSTPRSSSTVAPTHVKCAIASIPSSCLIRLTIAMVRSRVEPPAPYVTDTNAGSSCLRTWAARHRFSSPSSVFGGKNSNEKTGRRASRISSIRMVRGYARASGFLAGRHDVEVRRELLATVHDVLDVDRVVLPVGTEKAEEDGGPAHRPEAALLLQVPVERQRVPAHLVVDALRLRHAVHEHAVGRLGAPWEWDCPARSRLHAGEGSHGG